MLVLIGESGCGKSTIQNILVKNFSYEKVVTYTTRKPREGEQNHIDYNFVSEDWFKTMNKNGFFVESAKYNNWFYGIAKKDCSDDKVVIVTPHGLRQLKKIHDLNIISVYLEVPRRDRLIKILQRGDDINECWRRDLTDIGMYDFIQDEVDHVVQNKGFETNPTEIAGTINMIYKFYKLKESIKQVKTT